MAASFAATDEWIREIPDQNHVLADETRTPGMQP
jgi:hypothetical protein